MNPKTAIDRLRVLGFEIENIGDSDYDRWMNVAADLEEIGRFDEAYSCYRYVFEAYPSCSMEIIRRISVLEEKKAQYAREQKDWVRSDKYLSDALFLLKYSGYNSREYNRINERIMMAFSDSPDFFITIRREMYNNTTNSYMEGLNTLNLKHTTRVIGFGHVASIIISRIEDIPVDKIVFLSEYEIGAPKTLISEIDYHSEIKFIPYPERPTSDEKIARKLIDMINEQDLFNTVIEGAERIIFVTALPSVGGYALAELTKGLSKSKIESIAFLQLPFSFEGEKRCGDAERLCQSISENVTQTKVLELDNLKKFECTKEQPMELLFAMYYDLMVTDITDCIIEQ